MDELQRISFNWSCAVMGIAAIAFVLHIAIALCSHRHRWVNEKSVPDGVSERGYRRFRLKQYCPDCGREQETILLLPNGGSGTTGSGVS